MHFLDQFSFKKDFGARSHTNLTGSLFDMLPFKDTTDHGYVKTNNCMSCSAKETYAAIGVGSRRELSIRLKTT